MSGEGGVTHQLCTSTNTLNKTPDPPSRSLLALHPASAPPGAPGATPWRHYCSLGGGNERAAARLAAALAPLVRVSTSRVAAAPTPSQTNGADCGLHVLVAAGAVAGALAAGGRWGEADAAVAAAGTAAAAAAERLRLRESLLAAWRGAGSGQSNN